MLFHKILLVMIGEALKLAIPPPAEPATLLPMVQFMMAGEDPLRQQIPPPYRSSAVLPAITQFVIVGEEDNEQ